LDFFGDELDEVLNIFQQESSEILQSMNDCIVVLQETCKNEEVYLKLFRYAHSLKGSVRMLGFARIQDVVHRMEDVIWLVKENKIEPNYDIVNVLSQTLDYIVFLIKRTVENKSEFYTDDIDFYIQNLQNIGTRTDDKTAKINEEFVKNLNQIKALIIEVLFFYLKYKEDADFDCIDEFKNKVVELQGIFKNLNIQHSAEKLESIYQAVSEIRKTDEGIDFGHLQNLEMKFSDFVRFFDELCSKNNLEKENYFEIANNQLQNFKNTNNKNKKDEHIEIKKISNNVNTEFISLIKDINEDIENLKNNKIKFEIVENKISQIKNEIEPLEIKRAYKIILKILKNCFQKGVFPNDDIDILKQIVIDSADIIEDANANNKDYEIFEKRVVVLEEAFNNFFESFVKEESNNNLKIEIPVKKNKFNGNNWFDNIDSGEIKTLRVDSSKLDKLVNQVNELILLRIKNTEYLTSVKKFQNEFEDWIRNWHKIGYYLKYYEKKYLLDSGLNLDVQSVISHNKQLLSLYSYHSESCNKMLDMIHFIVKQMQEGDSKLSSLSTELETMTKTLRILPLATIFHLFPRMVHNIASENGKKIDFRIEGSEVSADKKIIEEIKMPLVHILRNSIDHGIETIEERTKLGKNSVGKILISAKNVGNKIIIDVKDDGKGIDIEKVRQTVIKKGLVSAKDMETITNEEIMDFIFYPGFTTEDKVTELSGRGLGLDIVRNKITQLDGKINVISQLGEGTCVRIELPVAMATTNVFIVSEKDVFYAVDTSNISVVVKIMPEDIFVQDNKSYFVYRKKVIPIFSLSQILGVGSEPKRIEKNIVMILKQEENYLGIVVDKLIGDQEILQKKLSAPFVNVKNISGITTLANGETCLILNIQDIFSQISKKATLNIIASDKFIEAQNRAKYKILIADDSITTRVLQKNILQNYGYSIQAVSDGDEALELLKTEKFDLLITDYDMPRVTGFELVKKLREELKSDMPVIVLSSFDASILKNQFLQYGIEKYIQKSQFNQKEFTSLIDEIFKEKEFYDN